MKKQFKTLKKQVNLCKIIGILIVASCLATACDKGKNEEVFTLYDGWGAHPIGWISISATGTVAFGTTETDITFAQFLKSKMEEQPAAINQYIRLDFHEDGTVMLSGKANRYGIGKWELNSKTLKESNTLTLIGLDANHERIDLDISMTEDGLVINISNWDISKVIAKRISENYVFDFYEETNISDIYSWQEYVAWIKGLKVSQTSLIIKFDAIQSY
jgi:hypothetical protein